MEKTKRTIIAILIAIMLIGTQITTSISESAELGETEMAKTTDRLNLDGEDYEVMDSASREQLTNLKSAISEPYDPTKTYSAGDFALWDKYLVVCLEDITVPEDFQQGKWKVVSEAQEIALLRQFQSQTSPALLSPLEVENGFYTRSGTDSIFHSDATYITKKYSIDEKPFRIVCRNELTSAGIIILWCFLDTDEKLINWGLNPAGIANVERNLYPPENAAYIRITGRFLADAYTYNAGYGIDILNTRTEDDAYIIKLYPYKSETGFYSSSNSLITSDTSWITQYWNVDGAEKALIVYNNPISSANMYNIFAEVDENNKILQFQTNPSTTGEIKLEIALSPESKYIRTSGKLDAVNVYRVKTRTEADKQAAENPTLPYNIFTSESGFYQYINGTFIEAQDYYTRKYDVEEIQGEHISAEYSDGGNNAFGYRAIFAVDTNGNTLINIPNRANVGTVNNVKITVPKDAKYIYVTSFRTAPVLSTQVSIEDYVNEEMSYWAGKKIVWFGTSIPAGVVNAGGSGGDGAYPTRVGKMLGATVYNESVGSSNVRGGNFNYITEDDPMGYKGLWAINIFLSLSLSSAEKQAVADDWETWRTKLRGVSDVDLNNLSFYKSCSWDQKISKYLTGGSVGPVDLYVFDHGHNESGLGDWTEEFLCAEPPANDPTNRSYWIGAFAYVVQKILEDNPKARICIIGHYENDRKEGIVASQQLLADKWKFPLCRTWEMIGLSQNEITVDGTTKTITNWWFPDDLHPASDLTGKALQHYAETLYPFMRDVR